MMQKYNNFTVAYVRLVEQIYNHYTYESAPRGLKVRESLGHVFRISDPRNRLLYIKSRQFSLQYMVAECLWYMKGDNQTDWISNYSGFWRDISDDGATANSAYGARIFRQHTYQRWENQDLEWNQWQYVVDELKRDPDSRRAVIHIRMPQDSTQAQKDVPCTLTLQFFVRDSKLHMSVGMRSSDLIFGISYDIPAFTIMQEMLANELGLDMGEYMHTSNSLHIYERHFEMSK
jgi:thymidylate synthase